MSASPPRLLPPSGSSGLLRKLPWHWRVAVRLTSWLVLLLLVSVLTLATVAVLPLLAPHPPLPTWTTGEMEVEQGTVVRVEPTWQPAAFALRCRNPHTGAIEVRWFAVLPLSAVSVPHLLRHLHEHAQTDVLSSPAEEGQGMGIAWVAD